VAAVFSVVVVGQSLLCHNDFLMGVFVRIGIKGVGAVG
jgi:hypothetical protein